MTKYKEIEVCPAGIKVVAPDGKVLGYKPQACGEGYVYKDADAFNNNPDEVCYIAEHAFDYAGPDDILSVADIGDNAETRNTIIDKVLCKFGEDYKLTHEQAELFAEDLFSIAEWAFIETYIAENIDIEAFIISSYESGTGDFTEEQYKLAFNGLD